MFRFENPLDPSKDGQNPFIDGIRFHIRNSVMIKQEVYNKLKYIYVEDVSALEVLETILNDLGYQLDELTIADEHELLNYIEHEIC